MYTDPHTFLERNAYAETFRFKTHTETHRGPCLNRDMLRRAALLLKNIFLTVKIENSLLSVKTYCIYIIIHYIHKLHITTSVRTLALFASVS